MTTIIKFGGSSIKNSIIIKKVSDIITGYISILRRIRSIQRMYNLEYNMS